MKTVPRAVFRAGLLAGSHTLTRLYPPERPLAVLFPAALAELVFSPEVAEKREARRGRVAFVVRRGKDDGDDIVAVRRVR